MCSFTVSSFDRVVAEGYWAYPEQFGFGLHRGQMQKPVKTPYEESGFSHGEFDSLQVTLRKWRL